MWRYGVDEPADLWVIATLVDHFADAGAQGHAACDFRETVRLDWGSGRETSKV